MVALLRPTYSVRFSTMYDYGVRFSVKRVLLNWVPEG